MSKRAKHLLQVVLGSFLLTLVLMVTGLAQNGRREIYTGTVVTIGGVRGGQTIPFTLTIDSYTPDAEATRLAETLKRDGQDGLMKSISSVKRGVFQVDGQVGRDVNVVLAETDEEGERKLSIIFERWVGFFEARRGARSLDYPFSYAELYLDSDKGKGEGSLIPAARIRFKGAKNGQFNIEVENFGIYPARLIGIARAKR